MPFEWSLPTNIVFGPGRLSSAHKCLRGLGKRAFLVTSRSFLEGGARSGVLDELVAQLSRLGVETLPFGEIEPNPRTATIDRAAAAARAFDPRYVIALGGGSVMDAAKCIALLAVNEGAIWDYAHQGRARPSTRPQDTRPKGGHGDLNSETSKRRAFNDALPVVCIPTVAATGSEANQFAVITDWERRVKTTVFGKPLQPKLALIDPELTYSVPAHQTVDGGFDIITHVMETYLSNRDTHDVSLSDRFTEGVVETVVGALRRVLENPKDETGRSALSWCSAIALSGVLAGREGGWPVHALEHGLSAITDAPHGRGLAMLLPRIMAFDAAVIPEKIAGFNRRIFGKPDLDSGLVAFMKEVGAWRVALDFGIETGEPDTIFAKIADHALDIDGVWKRGEDPYLENVRPLTHDSILEILRGCL